MQANPGKTINKYNFSSLLNTAWMKAMVPQNIISGFRTCGVYPYKPTAILDHDPCVPQSNPQQESDDIPVNHDDGSSEDIENSEESNRQASNNADETSNWNSSMILPSSLSDESHFERRYEEGYDLHDPEYEAWLNVHHPEALNKGCQAPQSEVIESTSEPQNSVVYFFSDVMPIDELPLQSGDLTSESTVLLSTPHSPMLALSAVIPHDFTSAPPSQDSVSVPSPQIVLLHPLNLLLLLTLLVYSLHLHHWNFLYRIILQVQRLRLRIHHIQLRHWLTFLLRHTLLHHMFQVCL